MKYWAYDRNIFLKCCNIKINAEKGKRAKYMFSGFQIRKTRILLRLELLYGI